MLKRIFFFHFFLVIFCTYDEGRTAIAFEAGKISAVVNDRIISQADLANRLKLALLSSGLADVPEGRRNLEDQILQTMIDEALQLSVAEKYDIKVTDAEVFRAIGEFESRNNMKPDQFKELLKTNGIPLEILYAQIRANLSWRAYIHARFHGSVQIGEQDIDRSMKQFEIKKDKPQLLISEIFLSFDSAESELVTREKAHEFVREIRKGAPFSALAQQFSQNASAARGGDIGWLAENELDRLLAQALQNLQPGQVSDPVKTQGGYYILLLRERREAGESIEKDTLLSFVQVLFSVSHPFSDEKLYPVFMKAKSIAANSKSCGLLHTLIIGDKNIQIHEVRKARVSYMAPQLKEMLLKSEVGVASDPVLTEMGFMIFMVCGREDINPDNPTRDEVRTMLFEQKLEKIAQREMRDIRREAHLDIRMTGGGLVWR